MLPKILRVETLCKYSLEILYAMRQTVGQNGSTVPTNHIGYVINNIGYQNVMRDSDPPLYLTQTIMSRGEGIPSCSCRNRAQEPIKQFKIHSVTYRETHRLNRKSSKCSEKWTLTMISFILRQVGKESFYVDSISTSKDQ